MATMPVDLDDEIARLSRRLRELRMERSGRVETVRKEAKVKKRCAHQRMAYFKVSAHEWKCSVCGREGVWSDSWQYFGALICRKCGDEPAIEMVTCSDKCRATTDV